MIIDTSAIIAILRNESEAPSYPRAIADTPIRRASAVNFVESAVVIDARRDPIATRRFDNFIREAQISIEAVTGVQAQIARDAYRDFGKGSGHPAKLNFGDCFASALAKKSGEPLLFQSSDFAHMDIVSVKPRNSLSRPSTPPLFRRYIFGGLDRGGRGFRERQSGEGAVNCEREIERLHAKIRRQSKSKADFNKTAFAAIKFYEECITCDIARLRCPQINLAQRAAERVKSSSWDVVPSFCTSADAGSRSASRNGRSAPAGRKSCRIRGAAERR
jgi:ribonuclease VapC